MKKSYIVFLLMFCMLLGCTDKFEDFNTDKKNPAVVSGNSLFTNGLKELADQVNQTNVNQNIWKLWSQYWTETTYNDEANYDIVTRNIPEQVYRYYYREGALKDLDEAAKLIAEETGTIAEATKQNRLLIIDILNVYIFNRLVDIFGMAIYSEAIDIGNVYPKYEDGAAIYSDLISRLDAAISGLDSNEDSFGSADLLYSGNVDSWKKFANTLKIKIGINLGDVNPSLAKSTVESALSGAFTSSDDDCNMPYQSASPNQNPLYEEIISTGRKDYVMANTLVDKLNDLNDPRLFSYVDPNSTQPFAYQTDDNGDPMDTTIVAGKGRYLIFEKRDGSGDSLVYQSTPIVLSPTTDEIYETVRHYIGGNYGFSNNYAVFSKIHPDILVPDREGPLLTYTELLFYLAEAAERGMNVPMTAEEYYNMGITNSMILDWEHTQGDVDTYLSNPDVAYGTAEGDWKQKIGTQSWLAFYTRGLIGYTNWRRLDWPVFNLAPSVTSTKEIPTRFTFPINEQTLNGANYTAAAEAVGGDKLTTKIFWDMYDANE
ncbi:MAG: SusD/RagB family nutrient-binding outer membrane lipoprotein [Cytophagales bacterium]|nr:SusD/RagB family nutrient-binding outer membrane lipoprotein [Cytophagales bacterium]